MCQEVRSSLLCVGYGADSPAAACGDTGAVPVCPLLPLPSPIATLRCFSLCLCGPHPPLQAVAPSCSPAYFQMSLPHLLQIALCSEVPPSPTTPQWDLLVFRPRLSPSWGEGVPAALLHVLLMLPSSVSLQGSDVQTQPRPGNFSGLTHLRM